MDIPVAEVSGVVTFYSFLQQSQGANTRYGYAWGPHVTYAEEKID